MSTRNTVFFNEIPTSSKCIFLLAEINITKSRNSILFCLLCVLRISIYECDCRVYETFIPVYLLLDVHDNYYQY